MSSLSYKTGCYLAFVLSDASRAELIKFFPPTFERVICHHVTIAFKLDQELFDSIMGVMGDSVEVFATGHLIGQNIECFTVEINGVKRLEISGQQYHITHSLQSPAKPVDSNALIRSGADPKKMRLKVEGSLQLVKK